MDVWTAVGVLVIAGIVAAVVLRRRAPLVALGALWFLLALAPFNNVLPRTSLLMAERYPRSRFTGYDLSEDAIAEARREAARRGLRNLRFETRDVTHLDEEGNAFAHHRFGHLLKFPRVGQSQVNFGSCPGSSNRD